jgi:succinoglycan biosynthesis transport protein ExoP
MLHRIPSLERIRRAIGWEPTRDLESILHDVIESRRHCSCAPCRRRTHLGQPGVEDADLPGALKKAPPSNTAATTRGRYRLRSVTKRGPIGHRGARRNLWGAAPAARTRGRRQSDERGPAEDVRPRDVATTHLSCDSWLIHECLRPHESHVDLRQYARMLKGHWLLICASVLVFTSVPGAVAWTRTPVYAASTQVFVSLNRAGDVNESYAGTLFTQHRVASYAQLASDPAVLQRVASTLRLPYSVDGLAAKTDARVLAGSVIIDLTARDASPERAKAIADEMARQLAIVVGQLETPPGADSSLVNLSPTSPAQLPSTPVAPNKPLYLVLGALFGLVFGLGATVLREAFSKHVRTAEEAEAAVDARVIGNFTKTSLNPAESLVALTQPQSLEAEEYRRMRTRLGFLPSLTVTSAEPSEGTTAIAANLAVVFAQSGYRVLVVDANLRQPRLAELFGCAQWPGLTSVVERTTSLAAAVRTPRADLTLEVLPAGRPSSSPGELLASRRFAMLLAQLMERAEVVILTAPAFSVADAAIVAPRTDGVVLVTSVGSTDVDRLKEAAALLRNVDAQLVGLVTTRPLRRREHTGPARDESPQDHAASTNASVALDSYTARSIEEPPA